MMIPIRSSYSHTQIPPAFVQGEPYAVMQDPTYGSYAPTFDQVGENRFVTMPVTQFVHQEPPKSTEVPERRKRASKPKVKTGCITCKIRRVKCDEGKPACKRCTSTGRKCDGYESPRPEEPSSGLVRAPPPLTLASGDRIGIQLPSSMTVVFQGTIQERQDFHRFQHFTIPAFSGGSEADFWKSLVLRAGVQEPIIRTAILALGTLHEDYQKRGGKYTTTPTHEPENQRAHTLYVKALRQVRERLATQPDSSKLAIISSILFTCFEILRRNDMTAIVHYTAGMRELMRHMKSRSHSPIAVNKVNDDNINNDRVLIRQIPEDELDILLRVFARYDVQACTFAKPRAEPLSTSIPVRPPANLTLKDVKRHLDNLLIAAYQLIKTDSGGLYRYWSPEKVPIDWQNLVADQLRIFQEWHDALEKFFDASEVRLSPTDSKSLLGLRLQIKVAIILLKTSISCGPESTFDQYKPQFEEMTAAVERVTQSLALVDANPLDTEVAPFTMELGIVHPLFFIATKCRDARLRKRAIAQLRKAGKEGVWEGPIMAVVAKKMMQVEERGLIHGQSVPERNRIHRIQKSVDYDGRRVLIEMTLAQDESWARWETIRDAIPF